ncbi:MAG: choice-of-anchor L domain-containing protein [Myxococcota bacterium]
MSRALAHLRTAAVASVALVLSACPSVAQDVPTTTTGVMLDTGDDGAADGDTAAADDSADGDPGGPCVTNDDCALLPGLGECDTTSGECVGCLEDGDCQGDLTCNEDSLCEGCEGDDDCPLGTKCADAVCLPGCGAAQPCPGGFACCGETCVDLDTNVDFCGDCETRCELDDADASCAGGQCQLDACAEGFSDCNGMTADGCETEGVCSCVPSEVQPCYTGDPATQNVGGCADGEQTCNDTGTAFGPCTGDVTPTDEVCGDMADNDCDGVVDEDVDEDGDGFTTCGGDCCDVQGPDCLGPELVNPGAFEAPDNEVDDDCDGDVDEVQPTCDDMLASNSADPLDYARALDLCVFTEEMPANPEDATWGVIEAALELTNGAGSPDAASRSIRDGFGNNNVNQLGERMVVLSSGAAADTFDDANPGPQIVQDGTDIGTSAPFPADWLAANGGNLPNSPTCPEPNGEDANDPVMLRLRVRVPTNANSFTVRMFFFSAEYPEYVCTAFNDFFVTLVGSTDPGNPADGNIAVYDDGAVLHPVGVNILDAAPGLFTECTDGQISQCGTTTTNYTGCTSTAGLQGTGYDATGTTMFSCNYGGAHGGGTGWLEMSGNVTPGEIMEIRFAIWDTSDGLFDSTVLLDAWEWSVQASEPGINPG